MMKVDDSFLDGFAALMGKFEQKLQRAVAHNCGVGGDPSVDLLHQKLTEAHANLMGKMDELEDERDALVELLVRFSRDRVESTCAEGNT